MATEQALTVFQGATLSEVLTVAEVVAGDTFKFYLYDRNRVLRTIGTAVGIPTETTITIGLTSDQTNQLNAINVDGLNLENPFYGSYMIDRIASSGKITREFFGNVTLQVNQQSRGASC